MTNKDLLIQEIESLPSELLTEALNSIRNIKATYVQKELKPDTNLNIAQQVETNRYPLHNTQPYRYDDPTKPVTLEDWEFLQ